MNYINSSFSGNKLLCTPFPYLTFVQDVFSIHLHWNFKSANKLLTATGLQVVKVMWKFIRIINFNL